MNHPTGADTPANGNLTSAAACGKCHMWRNGYCVGATPPPAAGAFYNEAACLANGGTFTEGLPSHLWRINTDDTYSTFPTPAQWNAGTRKANTAADGSYANAVYGDVDLACGQCHGGGFGMDGKIAAAPYYDKATLAGLAKNIHQDMPAAAFGWVPDSQPARRSTSTQPPPSARPSALAPTLGLRRQQYRHRRHSNTYVRSMHAPETVTLTVTGDDGSDCNTTKASVTHNSDTDYPESGASGRQECWTNLSRRQSGYVHRLID